MYTVVQPVRSWVAWVPRAPVALDRQYGVRDDRARRWNRGNLRIEWVPRDVTAPATDDLGRLLAGDESEFDPLNPDLHLAGGVPIRFDASAGTLVVHTSIVGLPIVYLYRGAEITAIASDIHLIRDLPGTSLSLDARAVGELGRVGHPLAGRTLFKDLTLAPSGATLRLDVNDGTMTVRDTWRLPERAPLPASDFLEAQIAAFDAALTRIHVDGSFLSLTAGLDTRAVFATLARQDRLIPAATMTGVKRSLDFRAAEALCRAYGVEHHPIVFDDRFIRSLPSYVETASRLSGGLASLDQAPEVFMYDMLGSGYGARVSGNLGNQVGRGGTEGVSTRGADVSILSAALRSEAEAAADSGHWLLDHLDADEQAQLEFILTAEIPLTLASNYPIGNHFAKQQTPYADRLLIETLAHRPYAANEMTSSRLRIRMRDLGHRFLGEPMEHSFQRTSITRSGGVAASYPINWGWRAAGGVSPAGFVLGVATLVGMYSRAKGLDGGVLRPIMQKTGLPALHDFRETRRWLIHDLKEYTFDTLRSQAVSDLFDRRRLDTVLNEHYSMQRDRYQTVTFALDTALSHQAFCA